MESKNMLELEEMLRAHFASESKWLRARSHTWERLRSRMTEQTAAMPRTGWSPGSLFHTRFNVRIAGAIAAVLILTTAVVVPLIVVGGEEPPPPELATTAYEPEESEHAPAEYEEPAVAVPAAETEEPSTSVPAAAPYPDESEYAPAASPPGRDESYYPSYRPQPGATMFEDYERQPFVDTARDNVSTFSLDADRTSFNLALNWVRQGFVVDPDSVRAEEWINAFDYGYAPPLRSDSFAIRRGVVRHPLEDGKHLVRLAFQAPDVVDDRPLNVTLVLDASGSMGDGNRVGIARAAAEAIRQGLRPQDRIAVTHFSDHVIHDLTVRHQEPSSRDVRWSIDQLAPHGSTNVQAGLDLGVRLADGIRRERPDAWHYVILMSDGVANVDATNPFAILEAAGDYDNENPLRLITIGVGIENYNDFLLEQLAQHGNGWYRYLNDVEQARWTFSRKNWLALATPFADQTRAQVTWNEDTVRSWRLVGYRNRVTPDHTFRQNRREFAEIPSGAATTAFYEVELWDDAFYNGHARQLGEVELRWVDPETGDSRQQHADISGQSYPVAFDALNDPMFRFGAIVALAADRYGDRSPPHGYDFELLWDHLDRLEARLGHLDSYHDFRFLLEQLAHYISQVNPQPDTGYSR